jgi:hypothetical protein
MPMIYDVALLRRAIKTLGATMDGPSPDLDGPGGKPYLRCLIDAPQGKVWSASGTHVLKVDWKQGNHTDRSKAIRDALERIRPGCIPCDDAECDTCCPEYRGE